MNDWNVKAITVITVLIAGFWFSAAPNASATIRYVNVSNSAPASPYTNWASAAVTIQAAIDAALAGDEIVVTNGVYQTGGKAVAGAIVNNRVALTKAVYVHSVNGPDVTVIQGYRVPGTTNADGAVRCAYLTYGATLAGFTLTNGATRAAGTTSTEQSGGGVWCSAAVSGVPICLLSNCVLTGNSANANGGGAYNGTLLNCSLSGNFAYAGGGSYSATCSNCTFTSNSVSYKGGGANLGTLAGCTFNGNAAGDSAGGAESVTGVGCLFTNNSAPNGCGGADYCTLSNCFLVSNLGRWGGGSFSSTLRNCRIISNTATLWGGGVIYGSLYTCVLTGNSAPSGGATYQAVLNNCTLTANTASRYGGGSYLSTHTNSIVYYNDAPTGPNYSSGSLSYSCTLPLPTNGVVNVTNPPLFVDEAGGNLRLSPNSPCINAGNNTYVSGNTDLDGNLRIVGGTVDIGAYEVQNPTSVISYAWLQQYGLPTDGSADYTDTDLDGMNNWQEWVCGTNPTNAASALRLVTAAPLGNNVTVSWQSAAGVNYFLLRSADPAWPFALAATNIIGQAGTTSYSDTNAAVAGLLFYRVGVQP
jgi:hypothetical protein